MNHQQILNGWPTGVQTGRTSFVARGNRRLRTTYRIRLAAPEWEEVEGLAGNLFEVSPAMCRVRWIAIGHLALGRAQRIESGAYGDEADPDWAGDLRRIATKVFRKFQPGDGQI